MTRKTSRPQKGDMGGSQDVQNAGVGCTSVVDQHHTDPTSTFGCLDGAIQLHAPFKTLIPLRSIGFTSLKTTDLMRLAAKRYTPTQGKTFSYKWRSGDGHIAEYVAPPFAIANVEEAIQENRIFICNNLSS
ncbi:hypothetical protein VTL71DRAFT_4417 [Oculimacula yallundae]|uniref:Uncharacterized protein n=1 Tax=Oculimacula yallundae TaxID=86028 RepID=A0ABR4C4C1_9HELO